MKNLILLILLFTCFSSCKHKKKDSNEIAFPNDSNSYEALSEQNANENNDTTEPYLIILEEMPIFPGGQEGLLQFVRNNINYPQSAIQDSIEGKVYLKFVVKADGLVSRVEVMKGVRYDLDNECKRVIEMLPRFKPGKLEGKPVPVWYAIPITFTLKRNEESKGVLVSPQYDHHTEALKIKLYPNPAKEFIKIELSELLNNAEYNIISLKGQILKKGFLNDYTQTIDIQDLIDGMYVLNIKAENSIYQSQKFIIRK